MQDLHTQYLVQLYHDVVNSQNGINCSVTLLSLEHINERAVCNAIAPEKDVDGFHIVNIGKLCLDQRSMVPATPAAVWEIIKRAGQLIFFLLVASKN